MIAVIFEVEPDPAQRQAYLDTAAALRPGLEAIDGFISVERFGSLVRPERILSLSFWRDEAAVQRWRTQEAHRQAQALGRLGMFRDYRLRVAEVVRDYGLRERAEVPPDASSAHKYIMSTASRIDAEAPDRGIHHILGGFTGQDRMP